jgi:hypothetical protein
MTVLTRAELSRYQASALICPEPLEYFARRRRPRRKGQWRTELSKVPITAPCPPGRDEGVEPIRTRYRHKQCDGTPAVGYLEGLTGSNELQPAAGVLTKVANSNSVHVLHRST